MAFSSARKDLNILSAYQAQVKGASKKSREIWLIVGALILIVFLLLGLFYVKIQLDRKNLTMEKYSLLDELESPEYAEQSLLAEQVAYELEWRRECNDVLEQHIEKLNTVYRQDSSLFTDIERVAAVNGVTCDMLTYLDEDVTLQCKSANASRAAQFAKALEGELLSGVTFYGYTLAEGEGMYIFSVQGVRKGAEG